jgi:hypothetical protein
MNNEIYWGPAPWAIEDLDGKTIECNWRDARCQIIGIATMLVGQRPNGDLRIDLTSLHSVSSSEVTEQVISAPSGVFGRIQENPNQNIARFKLCNFD